MPLPQMAPKFNSSVQVTAVNCANIMMKKMLTKAEDMCMLHKPTDNL